MRSRQTTHSTPSPLLAVSARFEVEQVAGRHPDGPQMGTRSLAMGQCLGRRTRPGSALAKKLAQVA